MSISKILSLGIIAGIGYNQRQAIEDMIAAPIDIVLTAVTQYELSEIAKMIRLHQTPCRIDNFHQFLSHHFDYKDREPGHDYWGKPYQKLGFAGDYTLKSYGPDQEDKTDDDISLSCKVSCL